MDGNGMVDVNSIQEGESQNNTGLEVINIPLLSVDGTNNISLTRLLSQHGITLQAGPDITQLSNGQPVTINVLNSTSQHDNIATGGIIDGSGQVIFTTDSVDTVTHGTNGLPIVGNQMLCVPNISQGLTFVTDYSTISDVIADNTDIQNGNFYSHHGNNSLQYKAQSYDSLKDKKIFSHVVALLSDEVCIEMFSNHAAYMEQVEKSDVFQVTKQDGNCTVAGELWALFLLQHRLQNLLKTGKRQSIQFTKPEMCNKWTQTDKLPTADGAVQTHYPVKKEGLVNCGTMCEILLPSVTSFGREIKQSGRYNTNATTFLSHSVDEDMDAEFSPRTSRRKRKVPKRISVSRPAADIPAKKVDVPKTKGDNHVQTQRVVIVKDHVVTVADYDTQTNRIASSDKMDDNLCEGTDTENINTQSDLIEAQSINSTEESTSLHGPEFSAEQSQDSLNDIQTEAMGTDKNNSSSNRTFIHAGHAENTQSSRSMLDETENCPDNGDSNFIQSDVDNKLGTGEEFLAFTSASDYTPVTSEDSLQDDISNTAHVDPSSELGHNLELQKEDQIQTALRASRICFEEVANMQSIKPRPNVKKKTKKDYEALAPFKYFCDKCSFKSKRQSHLIKHMKFHETVRKMFYCKQCSFKTIRSGALRRHEMTHSTTILHCNQCRYTSDDFVSLDKHIKMKHDLNASKKTKKTLYMCPKCDYSSVMPARYASHLKTHKDLISSGNADIMLALQDLEKEQEPQTLQCSLCSYRTIRKEHLSRHVNNVHSDHRPFLCDTCGQSFKRRDALSQHKITHVDKLNRNYRLHCNVCKKPFRTKTHLNEHMAMHSNVRQFLCDICGTAFKTRSCQQKHIKSIHQNPRSFKCDQCMKCFNTKFGLLRHLRVHEKPQIATIVQNVSQMETIPPQIFQTFDSQPATLVQDIITTEGEVYETSEDNLQQVLLKTNDSSESATAVMYLPASLQPNCF